MSDQPHPLINRLPAIHLLYSTTAFPTPDHQTIADQLAAMQNPIPSGELEVSWALQQAQRCLGQIRFGDHELQVAGLPVPLHKTIIDRTIHVSHWPPQIKAALRQHQAHLSLVYTGKNTDPVEKIISLYTIAQAFENENLLGVANEAAWTAHPIADFLTPEKIANYRSAIPFNLWVGNVKYFVDEHNYWLVTKGHPVGATGLGMIAEIVWQLRGEAGERQVADPRVGLTLNGGGVLGTEPAAMSIHIFKR